MTSASGRRSVALAMVLAVAVLIPRGTNGATLGTDSIDVTVTAGGGPYSGTLVFDDVTFPVYGSNISLGQSVGSANIVGNVSPIDAFTGRFDQTLESAVAGVLSGSAPTSSYVCATSACGSGPSSFVGQFANLSGTAVNALPPDLVYTFDGTVYQTQIIPPNQIRFVGTGAINAFEPVATAASAPGCSGASCQVTVSPQTTFLNSVTNQQVPIDATVTFPLVTTAGSTTVTGVSNVAGQLASNLSFNTGASYIDVSTTAAADTSAGPITICVNYSIAGAVSDPTQLRLLHDENGTWVDVTTNVDTNTQIICGAVTSLSPFGVAGPAGVSTTTTTVVSSSTTTTTLFGCSATPASGCQPAAAQKASLALGGGKLAWKWTSSATVAATDFGNPSTTTNYAVCVYDVSGQKLTAPVPAGGICGTHSCWKPVGTVAFKYGNKEGTPDGVTKMTLKAGGSGKGKIHAKGDGANLHLPALPLTTPLLVQLQQSSSTGCWEAVYSTAKTNTAAALRAKSD